MQQPRERALERARALTERAVAEKARAEKEQQNAARAENTTIEQLKAEIQWALAAGAAIGLEAGAHEMQLMAIDLIGIER